MEADRERVNILKLEVDKLVVDFFLVSGHRLFIVCYYNLKTK